MSTACYHAFQPSPADPGQRNRSFASQEYCNNGPPTRISLWSQLPGLLSINSLWNAHPASVTFYWFNLLRELLHIFHCWIKAQRYHQTQGFTTASDSQGAMHLQLIDTLPSHIPGKSTHLLEAVTRFDTQFQQRWYDQAFNLSDPIWTSALPAEHFVRSNTETPVEDPVHPAPGSAREQAGKRLKLGKDFISNTALMVPVEPFPRMKPVITTMIQRLPPAGRFPKIPNENGTLSNICFKSSFAAPHNRCVAAKCVTKQTPPISRLHIDISVEPWKSKPEHYWQPLVEWLQHPSVSPHFRPSEAFKSLTPAANWS